jgi:hypothetical protein
LKYLCGLVVALRAQSALPAALYVHMLCQVSSLTAVSTGGFLHTHRRNGLILPRTDPR